MRELAVRIIAPSVCFRRTMLRHFTIASCAAWFLTPTTIAYSADLPQLCKSATQRAAAETGVPRDILLAISVTETGRKLPGHGQSPQPWPWAVNQAGDGQWFASKDAAMAYVSTTIDRGIDNIDIGCFQLNLHWHGKGFASLDQMFDPLENARYAAKHLKTLFA